MESSRKPESFVSVVKGRIERVIKKINEKVGDDFTNSNYNAGTWQLVKRISDDTVLKRFFNLNHPIPKSEEDIINIEKTRDRIIAHNKILESFFGYLIPKAVYFLGSTKTKDYSADQVTMFSVQEFIKQNTDLNGESLWEEKNLAEIFSDEKYAELKKDIILFFHGWKKLKDFGLTFDMSYSKNFSFIEENGKINLKLFDLIPIILEDKQKFFQAQKTNPELSNLFTIDKSIASNFQQSEEIFNSLAKIC